MAIGDAYITLEAFKGYLGVLDKPTTIHDADMQFAIDTACRAIEDRTGRQFNKVDVPSERRFKPLRLDRVYVDDFYSTDGMELSVDLAGSGSFGPLWTEDMFELYPVDGVKYQLPGFPYTRIDACRLNYFRWPYSYGREFTVKLKALWGWSAVPSPVTQACFLHANEIYNAKDAPFGVQGFGEMGFARIRDNTLTARLLNAYSIDDVLAG